MARRPLLLDLFCGAGGCAVGYHRAGFDIIGVDIKPQKRYPFPFVQADAMRPPFDLRMFDAVHASPPCEGYSRMRHLPWLKDNVWPMLLEPTLEMLSGLASPWVIENVADSPLRGITLCGSMFGLKVYRHRRFASNVFLWQPDHSPHSRIIGRAALLDSRRAIGEDGFVSVIGKARKEILQAAGLAMGIDWMPGPEISKAIPPAYTEFIGRQLIRVLENTES